MAIATLRPDVTALVGSVLAGQGIRTLLSWVIAPHRAVPRLNPRRAAALLRYGGWVLTAASVLAGTSVAAGAQAWLLRATLRTGRLRYNT